MQKPGLKTMSDNAIFSVLEVKRLQKLNKRDCFCLHSWFHFSWPFLRKNWLKQLMGQTKLWHHPPAPTTIHQHPPPAKICPPPPTTSQNISTTTYHFPKNGPPPRKSQNIFIYIPFRHCFNSFFFFEMQYSFPWRRFCVIKFWSVRFSNSKFLLHSVHFTIFKIF